MLGRIERELSKRMVETIGPPTSSVGVVLHEGPLSYQRYKRPDNLQTTNPPFWQSILLIQREDNDSLALVAGGVKQGETPEQAMMRETTEEVGLQLNPDNLYTLAHFPKISRKGHIQDRIVYSHELSHGTLSGLGTNWRHGMAPVIIKDPRVGADIDITYYYSNPRFVNDEVKRLVLFDPINLFFFRELRRFGGNFTFVFEEGIRGTGGLEWSGATQLFKGKVIESLFDIIE